MKAKRRRQSFLERLEHRQLLANDAVQFLQSNLEFEDMRPFDTVAVDIDSDEDNDAIFITAETASNGFFLGHAVRVYKNEGLEAIKLSQKIWIDHARTVEAGDLDNDGHLDLVVGTSSRDGGIILFNRGDGSFTKGEQTLGSSTTFDIGISDLDKDGDLDVVMVNSHFASSEVFLNIGEGRFADGKTLPGSIGLGTSVAIADMDLDLDPDIVIAGSDGVNMWRNDGSATFELEGDAPAPGAFISEVVADDFDNDGDLDLFFAGSGNGFNLSTPDQLYENLDGRFVKSEQQFSRDRSSGARSGDLNNDGLKDLAVIEGGGVRFWINLGRLRFEERSSLPLSLDAFNSHALVDLDGDSVLDVIASDALSRPTIWFNVSPVPGDADMNRRFDSGDLVAVFAHGEFEDGIAGNSTWSEGDWNCDGEFDSADLVFAFQSGFYGVNSRPLRLDFDPVAAVVDEVFLLATDLGGEEEPEAVI